MSTQGCAKPPPDGHQLVSTRLSELSYAVQQLLPSIHGGNHPTGGRGGAGGHWEENGLRAGVLMGTISPHHKTVPFQEDMLATVLSA